MLQLREALRLGVRYRPSMPTEPLVASILTVETLISITELLQVTFFSFS